MSTAPTGFSEDKFLGGKLVLTQPVNGYRAGVDPVFLAASVQAHPGECVLDMGCGAGAAALCLGTRVAGLRLVGIERQAPYAELARRNGAQNHIPFEVHEADIANPPAALKEESFDHVIMDPICESAARPHPIRCVKGRWVKTCRSPSGLIRPQGD